MLFENQIFIKEPKDRITKTLIQHPKRRLTEKRLVAQQMPLYRKSQLKSHSKLKRSFTLALRVAGLLEW